MVLMSTSGVLGRYITMSPPVTIWWRCLLGGALLLLYCRISGTKLKIHHKRDVFTLILGGLLLSGHWISYFYALHLSNVAIGMLSLFTYPVITAFLEPWLLKTKFQPVHLLLGVFVLLGVYFLAPEFNINDNYTQGIFLGILSSFMYALRNIILKKQVSSYHGTTLMFYQLLFAVIILCPSLLIFENNIQDYWQATLTLAVITTAIGHTLFVLSFKHFSISAASIISSSQPIYGIILGVIFLGEYPEWNTLIGGGLIVSAVIFESIRNLK